METKSYFGASFPFERITFMDFNYSFGQFLICRMNSCVCK